MSVCGFTWVFQPKSVNGVLCCENKQSIIPNKTHSGLVKLRQITAHSRGIYNICLKVKTIYQHVTGWTWIHLGSWLLLSKISPDTGCIRDAHDQDYLQRTAQPSFAFYSDVVRHTSSAPEFKGCLWAHEPWMFLVWNITLLHIPWKRENTELVQRDECNTFSSKKCKSAGGSPSHSRL